MPRLCHACLVLLLLAASSIADEKPVAEADKTTDKKAEPAWKKSARAAGIGDGIDQLGRDGLLITDQFFNQIFEPYTEGKLPPFVTSDAVLNAFHTLFEESVRRLELSAIAPLREILQGLLEALPKSRKYFRELKEFEPGFKRARLMLLVGLSLLGKEVETTEEEAKIVNAEVKRVDEATARLKPDWLGVPDEGFMAVDYAAFRPTGFYAGNERLSQFFRANRWLQIIPLRVNNDTELATALVLGSALADADKYGEHEDYFKRYAYLLGETDDFQIFEAPFSTSFEVARRRLAEEPPPRVNDQDRLPPAEGEPAAERSFRILPAYLLCDSPMLQQTGQSKFGRSLPSGLDLAAMLGSEFAREKLSEPLNEEINKHAKLDRNGSLYGRYLNALGELHEVEPDAPELFQSKQWQAKTCNTQLAAWSQMRHCWVLQTKRVVYYRLAVKRHPGFVEPVPEFFSALADLCGQARTEVANARGFEPDIDEYIRLLRLYAKLGEENNFGYTPEGDAKKLTPQESRDLRNAEDVAIILGAVDSGSDYFPWEHKATGLKAIKETKRIADELESGQFKHPELLKRCREHFGENLDGHWVEFEKLVRRCEALAHKQLREQDFNDSETEFLEDVGKKLAAAMFYSGNSWLNPRDDAPVITEVAMNAETGKRLLVGISRPRALYVLYPWKGERVLCQGAVLPYYEFANESVLTDDEWKQRLDSDQRPGIPEWLKPIVADGELKRPEKK